jgi:hypothetical protein
LGANCVGAVFAKQLWRFPAKTTSMVFSKQAQISDALDFPVCASFCARVASFSRRQSAQVESRKKWTLANKSNAFMRFCEMRRDGKKWREVEF